MARSGLCATLLALLSATGALAAPVYLAPDVPTAETLTPSVLLPWTVAAYGGTAYAPAFSVPGSVALDGLQRRDGANDWLFSLEALLHASKAPGGQLALPWEPSCAQNVVVGSTRGRSHDTFFRAASPGSRRSRTGAGG